MGTKIANKKLIKRAKVTDRSLIKEAIKALKLSYSPYSNFKVGVAVLKSNQKIYKGANIENASYPLCLCAERTALAHAYVVDSRSKILAMAVVCSSDKNNLLNAGTPCGACRQVISEFEDMQNAPIRIILSTVDFKDIKIYDSIKILLPDAFNGKNLNTH
ncbi:MAG: cytidine deaminase [Saprospiraceae bacterium]